MHYIPIETPFVVQHDYMFFRFTKNQFTICLCAQIIYK